MLATTRRGLLAGAGALSLSAAMGSIRSAKAAAPIQYVSWTFRPDLQQANVDFFNKTHNEDVKYSTLPWPQYHPTLEQRAFAGEIVDVAQTFHTFRERWSQNGLIRTLDELPGADEIKKAMLPAALQNLQNKDGKLVGLPYYTALYIMMYNEPMLQAAGLKPAGSWDELIEQSVKLKKDKVSAYPYLPNWNPTVTGFTTQFLTDCFAEGANVFDPKTNKLIIDQDPAIARVMERYQKMFELGIIPPEIFTVASTTDTSRLMFSGRYAYHSNHANYLQTIATNEKESQLAPRKAKMMPYLGKTGDTYTWTDSYTLNANSKNVESAWKLMQFIGANLNKDWYVQRKWAISSGVDNPYPDIYKQQDVIESYKGWIDLEMLQKQAAKGKGINAFKEAWYTEYEAKSVPIMHDMIRKAKTVPNAMKELIALQKSVG
jgi:ABC-type glycerol-3-phosphate transport system substrate-binding protein